MPSVEELLRQGRGYFKMPALPDEPCPKCHQVNDDKQFYIYRVVDRRGIWYECDTCGHDWPGPRVAWSWLVPGV